MGSLWGIGAISARLSSLVASLFIACAAIVCCLITPGSAGAATGYAHLGEFGGSGSAPGLFSTARVPQAISVHGPSGKVFIADRGNNRVQVFTPTATAAQFSFSIAITDPSGVAVDQESGDLYVTTDTAIAKFNPQFDPGDPGDPFAYQADTAFVSPPVGASTGEIGALRSGSNTNPNRGEIVVDPVTRDILVIDTGKNVIHRYHRDGWQDGAGHLRDIDG